MIKAYTSTRLDKKLHGDGSISVRNETDKLGWKRDQ